MVAYHHLLILQYLLPVPLSCDTINMRRNRLLHSTPASRQRITPKPSTINKKQLNNSKLLNIIWLPGWRRYMVGSGLAWLGPGVADHFPFGVDRVVISERTVFGPRCLVKQTVCAYDCLANSYINGMLFHARLLRPFVRSFVCLNTIFPLVGRCSTRAWALAP